MKEHITDLIDRKNEMRIINDGTCRLISAEIQRECRRAKSGWIEGECIEIEQLERDNNTSEMYQWIMSMKQQNRNYARKAVMSKDREMLQESNQIAERWQEYMNDLYVGPLVDQMEEEPNLEEGLTTEEIMSSLIATKNNKSPGPDGIPIELVKAGGECVHGAVTHIIKKVYECEIICGDFVDSEFITIPKKPNTIKCEEQRTIAITSHTSKVLYRCVQRIAPILFPANNELKYGFMPNRGTIIGYSCSKENHYK